MSKELTGKELWESKFKPRELEEEKFMSLINSKKEKIAALEARKQLCDKEIVENREALKELEEQTLEEWIEDHTHHPGKYE